jgi:2-polyprenyl-6-methoxyphenol hydroxylase-like FAD-dependent oxidoreductase
MVDEETPALIVGGSLVGLSTAVFLGHHGIRRSCSSDTRAPPSTRARPP